MNVGFMASVYGKKSFGDYYKKIINVLDNKKHSVIHTLDVTEADFAKRSKEERAMLYHSLFNQLQSADIVIVDASIATQDIIYGISYLVTHMKQVIVLYHRDMQKNISCLEEILSPYNDRVVVHDYTKDSLSRVLDNSLCFMQTKVDKRFHIIIPAKLMDRLDEITKRKKVPKATYIRQLLETQLPGAIL